MKKMNMLATPPEHIVHLITIRDAKRTAPSDRGTASDHKAVLTVAHSSIRGRYEKLEEAILRGELETLKQSSAMKQIAVSLRSCYDNDTKALRYLKAAIAAAQDVRFLKYCPMCGTTLIATHDHYLPAVLFPEYAVHPLNLIPCCSTCNSTKGDDWLNGAGERQYLYAYSDVLPLDTFLHVELRTSTATTGVGAVFSLKRPARFSKKAWSIIESHFQRLNLIGRYTDQCNDEIAEILADCKIFMEASGSNKVAKFLRARAEERANVYGVSHWRACLMNEMASSPLLIRWLAKVRR